MTSTVSVADTVTIAAFDTISDCAVRPLTGSEYDGVGDPFGDLGLDETSFSTEEEKEKWLDERMNQIYLAVRLVLPQARFAAVKKEQIEWLKKRDAASSVEEKCKLTEARTKALQELLW